MNKNKSSLIYVNEIKKSPEDKRCYRALELENKLKLLLISDSDTDKAAAALNVGVGFLSDPDEVPGLAHFCEHMLFLGTEKYPVENDYMKYINENGGMCNATTLSDYTTFYFDILPEHFEGALDRFAQFFICPLFNESSTKREINAVNSEFEKNVANDNWRLLQMERHISKKSHPFHKFGIGNFKTLAIDTKEKGVDIREELLKFHRMWYSSNIMTLAILGKESLDELQEIGKSLFSNISNKNIKRSEWNEHPYGPEHLQIKGYIVPLKDIRTIHITFPAPDFQQYYKSSPFRYATFLIGHEGPGSLLSSLKGKGWCNYLESEYFREANGIAFFNIKADLTEDGMEHIDDIATLVFQYINLIKKEEPKKWIFDECSQLQITKFQFKEKEKPVYYVNFLAKALQIYPIEEVLTGPYYMDEWNPNLITEALSYLQPKFARIAIVGQAFEKYADEKEPWFGTKYKIEKILPSTIEKWENCGFNDEFKLPLPNEFITSNYEILPRDEKTSVPHPNIIVNTPMTRVWYKQDDEFLLPKANLKFEFSSPLAYLDPVNCGLTCLFVHLVRDSLNEYTYNAEMAGLKWNFNSTEYGLTLGVSGFSDKQALLLDKILERMVNFKVDPKRFEYIKELYVRSLKNFESEQPWHQAIYYLSLLMSELVWSNSELLKSVEYVTLERLRDFIPQLLSRFHVECLIHGNVDKEGAKKIVDIIEKRLTSKSGVLPMLPEQLLKDREIQLVNGTHFKLEMTNPVYSSSCAEIYYQCDVLTTKNNMLMELLVQMMYEQCHTILRTKEQLGYVVTSSLRRSNCVQGLRIVVQSDRHPSYVDQRIEAFLIEFRQVLEEMSTAEFERHRECLATSKLEKPKRLSTLSVRYWNEISSQQYHFNRAEVEVAFLRTLTKEDILNFFDEFIKFGAPRRRKISIHVLAKGEGGAGNSPEPDIEILSSAENGLRPPPPFIPPINIEDVTKFKSSHGLYPLTQPYMNIPPAATKSKL